MNWNLSTLGWAVWKILNLQNDLGCASTMHMNCHKPLRAFLLCHLPPYQWHLQYKQAMAPLCGDFEHLKTIKFVNSNCFLKYYLIHFKLHQKTFDFKLKTPFPKSFEGFPLLQMVVHRNFTKSFLTSQEKFFWPDPRILKKNLKLKVFDKRAQCQILSLTFWFKHLCLHYKKVILKAVHTI